MELISMADFNAVRDFIVHELNRDRRHLAFWSEKDSVESRLRKERLIRDIDDTEVLLDSGKSLFQAKIKELSYDQYAEMVHRRAVERMSWGELASELKLNPWHIRIHYDNARQFFKRISGVEGCDGNADET